MTLSRLELDVISGIQRRIEQNAFRNKDNEEDVIVLDVGQTPPDGYYKFDPGAVDDGGDQQLT